MSLIFQIVLHELFFGAGVNSHFIPFFFPKKKCIQELMKSHFFLWPIIITIIIATTNEDNEDNVMVLGEEEWEDLFGNRTEIANFNKFTCE